MGIIAAHTAPNFAFGNYFRIQRMELVSPAFAPDNPAAVAPHLLIMLGFYANAEARNLNTQPMYVHTIEIPLDTLETDPREWLYQLVMQSPLFAGTNARSDEEPAPSTEQE